MKPITVVKIGTNLLTTPSGKLDLNNLRELVNQLVDEWALGKQWLVLVTSGAITTGSERLGLVPESIPQKQAAAAVGQILLMQEYGHFFGQRGIPIGQLLLSKDAFLDPVRSNHISNTLVTLLKQGVLPIINENDTVATDEIRFGDNDELSCLVTALVGARTLYLMTDIDGLYTANPKKEAGAVLMEHIPEVSEAVLALAQDLPNQRSRGGMRSKLLSAREAALAGAEVVIANGRRENVLANLFSGKAVGTRIGGSGK